MTASASTDTGPDGFCVITVGVSYNVSVIATPYDFKIWRPTYPYGLDGTLYFNYKWKSTTGNLADLDTEGAKVTVYEHTVYGVDAQHPNGSTDDPYFPQNPPFAVTAPGLNNPMDYRIHSGYSVSVNGGNGKFASPDTHQPPDLVPGTGTFTAIQEYRYYHPLIHGDIGDGKYEVLDGDGASHSIVRTVTGPTKINGVDTYLYTVTKQGESASKTYPQ